MLRTAHFRLASQYEETLWAVHEADIGDFFETHETVKVDTEGNIETDQAGKMLTVKKQRPRLLSDLPPDLRKLIEHIQIDSKGNMTPQRSAGVFLQQDLPPAGSDRRWDPVFPAAALTDKH
jgi:hypothetical protein